MCVCVYLPVHRERDFKVLAHTIMEAGNTKICRGRAGSLENQEGTSAIVQVWRLFAGRIHCFSGNVSLFYSALQLIG